MSTAAANRPAVADERRGGSSVDLRIVGMHCASCVSRVEAALASVPGVAGAAVNLATERAHVRLASPVTVESLRRAVADIGYDARAVASPLEDDAERRERRQELEQLGRRFRAAALLSAPVVVLGNLGMFPPLSAWMPMPVQNAVMAVLCAPVQWWAGWPFVRGAWISVARRAPDMNLLIGLGTLAAWSYSMAATLAPDAFVRAGLEPHTYFDTAAVIVTLILLGRLLEARAKAGTSQALRRLMDLRARTARRLDGDVIDEVPLDDVVPGDLLLVRPGERVPVDGVIEDGRTTIDRSMLTGEPVPVAVGPGDAVTGATLNQGGAFRMRAQRVGGETTLMQIVRMVQEAQGSKAAIARLADRIAAVFVPVVIGIAVLASALWAILGPDPKMAHALLAAVSVLIIACPCALGLATPTALVAGIGRGAELGVLVRGADALEAAERIDALVFDKTGTLTRGRPDVASMTPAAGVGEARLLAMAASVEQHSEHPLAAALVRAAQERDLTLEVPDDVAAVSGRGVVGVLAGAVVVVGTPALLAEYGAALGPLEAERERLEDSGATVIAVAQAGETLGLIAVTDVVRPEAATTVAALTRDGIDVWLITGDNSRTAAAVARAVGIAPERVLSQVMPEDKAKRVVELQASGRRVAMVGDGINDAPALAQADLGLAMGTGTDIAMEAAPITLVRGDLGAVPIAIGLARRTLQVIRQNLFWAFIYNVIGIPIAAGLLYVLLRPGGPIGPVFGWQGTLNPMVASLAMAFSSVSVLTSSLRLRRYAG